MYSTDNDPVAYCIEALQTGQNKQIALEKAKFAQTQWWAITTEKQNISEEEVKSLLQLRAIVLATLATVYVWNSDYEPAYLLENQFLYTKELWVDNNRQVIEGYLSHLVYQKQFEHLDLIFQYKDFNKEFRQFENIYKSVLDKNYPIKGNNFEFVTLVNRINNYSLLLNGCKAL